VNVPRTLRAIALALALLTLHPAGDRVAALAAGQASVPVDVLRPEAAYECPDLPLVPSAAGEIEGKAQQLRDPGVFEEGGKTFLFYSICGEQGLAGAELTFR
jgi:hypothetical protein